MLALTSNLDSSSALFVVNRDGSGLRELARLPVDIIPGPKGTTQLQFRDFQPGWSSDDRLVYVSDGLVVTNSDGSGRKTVLAGVSVLRPRWAPRDSAITYINGTSSGLEIVRVDGSNARQLVTIPGKVSGQAWSPDGSSLAINTYGTSDGPLYVLDSRTLLIRQIARVPYASSSCWSPDSRFLSFVHAERAPVSNNEIHSVSIARSDGSNLINLEPSATFLSNRVSWSADGGSVIFLSPTLNNGLSITPMSASASRRFTTEGGIAYFAVSGVRCSWLFNM